MNRDRERKVVKGASFPNAAVLGTFTGECADATITNKNGLDITREVWENVFNSDDYKQAIDLGWLIGYLGHPEDPNCMDFKDACIVMTEGHIDNDGKVHGTFNLIDTPVGQIVKKFIDAGVTFGISVRGAGDIISNSVDPDTFIFRGFDLVTFPAYPEAIPTFSEVAAASDAESQKKYSAICAAVSANINGVNTINAVDAIQSCFAAQSDTYKQLEARKAQIKSAKATEDNTAEESESVEDVDMDELQEITAARVKGLTSLYIDEHKQNADLIKENARLKLQLKRVQCTSARKAASMKRIMTSQLAEMDESVSEIGKLHASAVRQLKASREQTKQARAQVDSARAQAEQSRVQASSQIKRLKTQFTEDTEKLNNEINALKSSNLKYKQKVEASVADIREKDTIIASLRAQVTKTVQDKEQIETDTSNLDATNKKLLSQIKAAQSLLTEYQNAYANLYASATGVTLNNVAITATTSTSDLRRMINRAAIAGTTSVETEDGYYDMADESLVDEMSDELVIL